MINNGIDMEKFAHCKQLIWNNLVFASQDNNPIMILELVDSDNPDFSEKQYLCLKPDFIDKLIEDTSIARQKGWAPDYKLSKNAAQW